MPRKSLRPHLNQIRAWVRQGRTDAWVAHQLEVTVRDIEQFKRQNELVSDEEVARGSGAARLPRGDRPARRGRRADRRRARGGRSRGRARQAEAERATAKRRRRRGRGRGRRTTPRRAPAAAAAGAVAAGAPRARSTGPLEGTFDHGEEGYGLWLDPAIQENPIYAEHWAGHRPVEVAVEEDRIVIRRVGGDD